MTHGSVFSGIGGPEVAASMLGWENLFHCEINPFGRQILDYYYPNAESYEDITKTDFTKWRGKVNVLTGGFPCQPFSYAGQRRGAEDDRYLWPHMHRCINEIQPDWVVCENVAGITTMVEQGEVTPMASAPTLFDEDNPVHRYQYRGTFTLERICCDLEADGYEVFPVLIPACSVGAPHKRDRVFIVGHRRIDADANSNGYSAQAENLRTERSGRADNGQPSQRSEQTERTDGLAELLRPDADTDGFGNPSQGESAEGDRQGADIVQRETGRGQGHASSGNNGLSSVLQSPADTDGDRGCEVDEHLESKVTDGSESVSNGRERDASDTTSERPQAGHRERKVGETCRNASDRDARGYSYFGDEGIAGEGRWDCFPSQSPVHRGNDGLPFPVDDLTIPFPKWRNESLKAYGNAIVPQVMYEIFRAIELVTLS